MLEWWCVYLSLLWPPQFQMSLRLFWSEDRAAAAHFTPQVIPQDQKPRWLRADVPNLSGTRDQFCGRQFSMDSGQGEWLYSLQPDAACHLPLTDRVLIGVCKQLIYYGLCAVQPLC